MKVWVDSSEIDERDEVGVRGGVGSVIGVDLALVVVEGSGGGGLNSSV
jgi:hypothetical protein